MTDIRAKRERPGLMRQHLTAVRAAASICGASLAGAEIKSRELEFRPGRIMAGTYQFAVGTAGSALLVVQTVLPALLTAPNPSELVVEGGTHNPMAPPFDFFRESWLPLINRMGPELDATLERFGFYPAGGGRVKVTVRPAPRLEGLLLTEWGEVASIKARVYLSSLPSKVGEKELRGCRERLNLDGHGGDIVRVSASSAGNVLVIKVKTKHLTEVFTGFGSREMAATKVARRACGEVLSYLSTVAPVGPYLADQILLPLAMAGSGMFLTAQPTAHFHTNIHVIGKFLDVAIACEATSHGSWLVKIGDCDHLI